MKRILAFDYDGVIVDSLNLIMKIFNDACRKYSFEKYNIKEIKDKEEFVKLFDSNFYDVIVSKGMPKEKIPQIIEFFRTEQQKLYQNKVNLFDDVKSMLKELSKTNKIIVITSNITKTVKDYLLEKGINEVDEIVGADIETSKIKKIQRIKSEYPNSEIYYIGDTKGDIIEGKEAKVKTVATTWGYHNREKLEKSNPDFIVDSTEELVNLFKT